MIAVFRRAVAAARAQGRVPRFWLRDDDATRPGPALERLVALCARHGIAPTLAVVPARLDPALAGVLAPGGRVALHGWAHVNHAPRHHKKAELGPDRPAEVVLAELARGRARLREVFGPRALDLLVPPWNRIAPDVAAGLPAIGIRALSAYGRVWTPAVPVLNALLDPIDWHRGRGLRDPDLLWQKLALCLVQDRPIGVLTHHRDHVGPVWGFLDRLMGESVAAGCLWLTPDRLLPVLGGDLASPGVRPWRGAPSFSSR